MYDCTCMNGLLKSAITTVINLVDRSVLTDVCYRDNKAWIKVGNNYCHSRLRKMKWQTVIGRIRFNRTLKKSSAAQSQWTLRVLKITEIVVALDYSVVAISFVRKPAELHVSSRLNKRYRPTIL